MVADQPELVAQVEPTLLVHARTLDPERLAVVARRVVACLDPDGVLATDRDQARRRDATLVTLPDGSGRLTATLTSEAVAVWTTVLDTLSRPVPAEGAEPDRRTPGQRRHDALVDAGRRLLRSGDLPDAGGTPATVLLTLTLDQLETRLGLATTAHGGTLTIPAELQLAADAQIVPAVLETRGAVLHLGRTRRTASPAQRLALAARDQRMLLPWLRPAPRLVRNPPRQPVGRRRHHRHRKSHPRSAAFTTASTPNAAGRSTSSTASPNGSRPAASTPSKPAAATHPPPTSPLPTRDTHGGATTLRLDRRADQRSSPTRLRQLSRLAMSMISTARWLLIKLRP